MNDTELDELLNAWRTPPPPASMRERVRAGIAIEHRRPLRDLFPSWKWLSAGAAVAMVVLLFANSSAFSGKLSPPPFTVDSEITLHNGSQGCLICWMSPAYPGPKSARMTSYNQAGSEVVVSWTSPDQPMEGAFWGAKLRVSAAIEDFKHRFLSTPDEEAGDFAVVYPSVDQSTVLTERATLVNSGCRAPGPQGKILGQEVILNYPTVTAEYGFWKKRITVWMAPALSCFALRTIVEAQQPDGSWTTVSEKKALKVTVVR